MSRKPNYKYNIVLDAGKPVSVTVFHHGQDFVATTAHPNFNLILAAIQRGDKANVVVGLFDTYQSIGDRFKALVNKVVPTQRPSSRGRRERLRRLSKKIEIKDNVIYYEGERLEGVLADTIGKYFFEGNEDVEPLALFLEKVMSNPNPHSREQLYEWLRHFSFKIAEDGDFIGYKYTSQEGRSTYRGVGIVNGKRVHDYLQYDVGNVVEMPRKMVAHNPRIECSTGLHVGTWNYVSGRERIVRVKVNPRDVVSVPTDCNGQKLRVCRFEIIEEAKSRTDSKIFAGQSV